MQLSGATFPVESMNPADAGARGQRHLTPSPVDARWDPTTLPTDEADEEPRWTELQLASRSGDIQRVNKLLSRCSNDSSRLELVNQPAIGYYGQTALQAACMRGHEVVARSLLEAGAELNAPGGNNMHRNAFELACGAGNIRLIHLLLDAGAIVDPKNVTRYQGRTPIQAAAEGGHEAVVFLLLDNGADINAPASPSSGVTALQSACYQGNVSLVKLLISRGADVNSLPGKFGGYTALQGACLSGDGDMVRILVDAGAEVNAPGSLYSGGTALHAAVSRGHIQIVKLLLSAGADPNGTAGHRGQTPMQSAYLIRNRDIVNLLREAGAIGPLAGGRILFGNGRIRSWTEDMSKRVV